MYVYKYIVFCSILIFSCSFVYGTKAVFHMFVCLITTVIFISKMCSSKVGSIRNRLTEMFGEDAVSKLEPLV